MSNWGKEKQVQFIDRKKRADIKVQPINYGMSALGGPLHAYLPGKWEGKRTLIMAGIHGEEPETSNLLSYALRSIKPSYLSCAVIICANPDGMARGTRGNAHNVDLNRNFPSLNWRKGITTTRWEMHLLQDTELKSGMAPASETETKSLINFINQHKIKQIVSLHAPMGCIDYEQNEEWPLVNALSKKLCLPIVNDIGYPCPGSMDSWASSINLRLVTVEIENNLPLTKIRQKYGPVIQELLLGELPGL